MAHSSLRNHRKLTMLMRRLGVPRYAAHGLMSLLWDSAYDSDSVGIDGRLEGWSDDQVAAASDWEGDSKKFVEAVVYSGFLDVDDGCYVIHDYKQWAPEYVKKRIQRRSGAKNDDAADNGGQRRTTADDGRQCLPTEPKVTEGNRTEGNRSQPKTTGPIRCAEVNINSHRSGAPVAPEFSISNRVTGSDRKTASPGIALPFAPVNAKGLGDGITPDGVARATCATQGALDEKASRAGPNKKQWMQIFVVRIAQAFGWEGDRVAQQKRSLYAVASSAYDSSDRNSMANKIVALAAEKKADPRCENPAAVWQAAVKRILK